MTKIVVKSASQPVKVIRKALAVLLSPRAILAYHESEGWIYIADNYADTAVSFLKEEGIPVDVVKRSHHGWLSRVPEPGYCGLQFKLKVARRRRRQQQP